MSAGKGDKLRKGANLVKYRDSPIWKRSTCCNAKVSPSGEAGNVKYQCMGCAKMCEVKGCEL